MFGITKEYISRKQDVSKKNFAAIFILLFNTLSWYYMVWEVLFRNYENVTLMWIGFDVLTVISMIFAVIFLRKSDTSKFLFCWICFGVFSSLLFMLFKDYAVYTPLISSLLGISVGLGVPYSLSAFANLIDIKNRGLAAGIILLLTMIVIPLTVIIMTSKFFGDSTDFLLLAVWRGGGLTIFIFKPKLETQEKKSTFKSVLQDRSFVLYCIPWLMFLFVNQFESMLLKPFFESHFGQPTPKIGPIVGALFSLIGGFFADTTGRRRVVIYGFASLGFAYAILSFSPEWLVSWYFFFLMNGAAWGIIFACFTLILWGDLSQNGDKEKYYTIGNMPFFLTDLLRLPSFPFAYLPPTTSFSLASLFLFVAVLPLMFAPETLPEKKLRERELKKYIEKAKKIKEKYV